jgi:hypothetical protein
MGGRKTKKIANRIVASILQSNVLKNIDVCAVLKCLLISLRLQFGTCGGVVG